MPVYVLSISELHMPTCVQLSGKDVIRRAPLRTRSTMKVAMLTYSTRPRGGVVHALKLAERLRALGTDVTVHSLARSDDEEALRGFFREVDVPYEIHPYEWHPDLMERLERMIASYSEHLPSDVDIFHAQDCVGGTALARMRERRGLSVPIFRTVHHIDDFAEPRLFEFEKRAVALADHRFVVSQYWKEALKNDYGLESHVTYNGIDPEEFSGLPPRSKNSLGVLFVGGLEPRKGLEHLILAMEEVSSAVEGVRLDIVAKAGFRGVDSREWFEMLAERAGIAGCTRFHSSVSAGELLSLYANCDVLALPSRNEGWGLSLMEAMACARPVVATRVGGIPELVRDGIDGLIVEPGDVRALASAMVRLLRDPAERARMGASGLERVRSFSWEETAKEVLARYREVLLSRPS